MGNCVWKGTVLLGDCVGRRLCYLEIVLLGDCVARRLCWLEILLLGDCVGIPLNTNIFSVCNTAVHIPADS